VGVLALGAARAPTTEAATGAPLVLGVANDADAPTTLAPSAGTAPPATLQVVAAAQAQAVRGLAPGGTGVSGAGATGVQGTGTGPGVHGLSQADAGVLGVSQSNTGVIGRSGTGAGVVGTTAGGVAGVLGRSPAGGGVRGESMTGPGVLGESRADHGVVGHSQAGAGVMGVGQNGPGVLARNDAGGVGLQVQGRAAFSTVGAGQFDTTRPTNTAVVANPAVTDRSHISVTLTSVPFSGDNTVAVVTYVQRTPGVGFFVQLTREVLGVTFTYLIVEPA
jgi:hypothetical protein